MPSWQFWLLLWAILAPASLFHLGNTIGAILVGGMIFLVPVYIGIALCLIVLVLVGIYRALKKPATQKALKNLGISILFLAWVVLPYAAMETPVLWGAFAVMTLILGIILAQGSRKAAEERHRQQHMAPTLAPPIR